MPVKMREIESIEKVTINRIFYDGYLSGADGISKPGFFQFLYPMPTTPVDEVVVRSARWNSKPKHKKTCGILSTNLNKKIAHFCAFPTHIEFRKPVIIPIHSQPEMLELKVVYKRKPSDPLSIEFELEIDLEFISYKKNH